ncbi:MAG: hypothetical protein L0I62_05280 [Gammaproteobacteria bacterium]|nr:hypothetical protein [Gammaproteobacteria bacterium]
MSCTVKICFKDWCIVIIHSEVAEQQFADTGFAKSIGYDGDASDMYLADMSAEPLSKAGTLAKNVPDTAQVNAELGIKDKRFTNDFQIDYDRDKEAYVWHEADATKSWFVGIQEKMTGLADSSVTFTFEGFEKYPDVVALDVKNKGKLIAQVSREG